MGLLMNHTYTYSGQKISVNENIKQTDSIA